MRDGKKTLRNICNMVLAIHRKKCQYFMKIAGKNVFLQKNVTKYFCIFFHFRTFCIFSLSEKNTYFGYGRGFQPPPPTGPGFFIKFSNIFNTPLPILELYFSQLKFTIKRGTRLFSLIQTLIFAILFVISQ